MYKFSFTILLTFIFLSSSFLFYPVNCNNYLWSENSNETIQTSLNITSSLDLESESAILIEQNSGKILFEKNSHEKLRPASVTKVMSVLLIMEALDNSIISLNDKVPCSQKAASMGGSQIWLDPREELTVDEMLKAICVASANDATVAMAEYIAGSEEAFVERMNNRAKELGMNDTTFKNCHGLDTDGHITSSYDIALMSKELLKNHPQITNYTTIYMDTLRDGKSELVNTNKLIRNYKGATGLKTGSTDLALYNLSASATRDNLFLIAVIMKAPTTSIRFSDAKKLLDYGFNNFTYVSFAQKDEFLKKIKLNKGLSSSADLVYENNLGIIVPKDSQNDIEQEISIPDEITAPVYSGQKIGEIKYMLNGEIVGTSSIISKNNIEKVNLFNMSKKLFSNLLNFLRKKD